MPLYTFRCAGCNHAEDQAHSMFDKPSVVKCEACGGVSHRVYKVVDVNWGGLKPSAGEYHPDIRSHLDNIDENRERFAAEHEAHERREEREEQHGK